MPAYVQNDALKCQELSAPFDKGNNNIGLMRNLFKIGNREGGNNEEGATHLQQTREDNYKHLNIKTIMWNKLQAKS